MKFEKRFRTMTGSVLAAFVAAALLLSMGAAAPLYAQAPLKVAAVFETPIEEPWVNQIHVALLRAKEEMGIHYEWSESVQVGRLRPRHAGIRRKGLPADHRRCLRRRTDRPPGRRGLSQDRLRFRFRHRPGGAQLRGLRQLDPRAGLPVRHDRRQDDQEQHHRGGGGDAHPGGQPPGQRLLRRRQGDQPEGQVQVLLHRLLLRPAQGQGSRAGPDRSRRGRDLRRAVRRRRGRQGKGDPGVFEHVRPVRARARHRRHRAGVGHVADGQIRDQPGEGRGVHGPGFRRVFLHGQGRLLSGALPQV